MRIPKTLQREPLEFENVAKGLYSSCDDHSVVTIRSQAKLEWMWEMFYEDCPDPPPIPAVDFETTMWICSFRGRFPTTGFSTTIKRVVDAWFRGGRFLWVVIAEYDPWGPVRMDFTSPFHIIRLPRSMLNVRPFFYKSLV